MSQNIEDYAMIGDCHSAALIGLNGSMDWLCLPHFDSPACFAALLGKPENGFWKVEPTGIYQVKRRYLGDTLVLETTFETESGVCRLTDAMLINTESPDIVRIIEGVRGSVDMSFELVIRFAYGSIIPWLSRTTERSFRAIAGPDAVTFWSSVPFENKSGSSWNRVGEIGRIS